MITGFVNGQDLRIAQPVIASGTLDYLTAQFKFVSAFLWDDCDQVRSVWTKGSETYTVLLTDGMVLETDHLNLSAGDWYVHLVGSVFAGDDVIQRITTIQAKVHVIGCGVPVDIDMPFPDVPATEAERLWAKIAELEQRIAELEQGGATKVVVVYDPETCELTVSGCGLRTTRVLSILCIEAATGAASARATLVGWPSASVPEEGGKCGIHRRLDGRTASRTGAKA